MIKTNIPEHFHTDTEIINTAHLIDLIVYQNHPIVVERFQKVNIYVLKIFPPIYCSNDSNLCAEIVHRQEPIVFAVPADKGHLTITNQLKYVCSK